MSQPGGIRNLESPVTQDLKGCDGVDVLSTVEGSGLQPFASIHAEAAAAQASRRACTLVTLVAATGSVPRAPGAKMLVYADGQSSGSIGGGKFESLVVAEALDVMRQGAPRLRHYPLHEASPDSFGAICGGEVSVFLEPVCTGEAVWIIGAGHCSQAIAKLAKACGLYVCVFEDRAEMLAGEGFAAADSRVSNTSVVDFIASREWTERDALIIVNRNPNLDKLALAAALSHHLPGYVGMMGSRRKVRTIFEELEAAGHSKQALAQVYAPIGLDIAAESPAEIAVSIIAELLQVCRRSTGGHLRGSVEVSSARCTE